MEHTDGAHRRKHSLSFLLPRRRSRAGAKRFTFVLRFRASDRTLTAAETTDAKLPGVRVASERFGETSHD